MPTVLVVADDPEKAEYLQVIMEGRGFDVIMAMLKPAHQTETVKPVIEVLEECKKNNVTLHGVLIADASFPKNHPCLSIVHSMHQGAKTELEKLQREAEQTRPYIEVERGRESDHAVAARIQEMLDAAHNAQVAKRKEILAREVGFTEHALLANPPTDKGTDLIRALRAEGSPYRDAVIVVDFAHPDKEQEFLNSGANQVFTSLGRELNGAIKAMTEQLAKRGIHPTPGAKERAAGPKSPADHARGNDSTGRTLP